MDVLRGHFHDGHAVLDDDAGTQRMQSVIDNLTRLFNTRRGAVEHLPEYGLPDISQVYRDLPYSIDGLRVAIKEVVERYEPRLRRIRVEKQEKDKDDEYDMRVSFVLSGELEKGRRVSFQTTFASHDLAEVRLWRKPS